MNKREKHSKEHCHHNHSHSHSSDGNIALAFFLNLSFSIIEIVGGILTNSVAIMSDAVHDFGDSVSLAFAWYFQRKSKKASTINYTYGYKRFSLIGAIVTSVVLIIGSIFILSEAIPRLFSPQETNAAGMFALAVLGIVVNGIAVLRTRKAASINERVVSLHMLEDALGWAAVLVGSVIMYFTGFTIIDPILSVCIALFVLFNVFKNIRQVVLILLQAVPADINYEKVAEILENGVFTESIHDLHIWSLDEENNILTVHLVLNKTAESASELTEFKNYLRAELKNEGINHATFEFDAPNEICELKDCNPVRR